MAVKKNHDALITELEKNIDTVKINLEKARLAEKTAAEKMVEKTFKAFEKANKKLITLKQKAPAVSAKKTPAQIARVQKWKDNVAEQKQVTSSLKIDLTTAKSTLANIIKKEKERQALEKEHAAIIKNILKAPKTKKRPSKNTPKTKTTQKTVATTKTTTTQTATAKTATKPTEKKPVKRKAPAAKATKATVTPKVKAMPKTAPIPKPIEAAVDQKEESKETTQTPIQADLIGMNPEFVSMVEPPKTALLEETLPAEAGTTEQENIEQEEAEKNSTVE